MCLTPKTHPFQLSFQLQAGGRGSYVSLVTEDGAGWSVACSSVSQATDLLRHLTVTAAHVGLHRSPGASVELSCVVEEAPAAAEGSEPAPVAADGDTASLSFTAFPLTTVPSAKPTDVFKAPPVCSNVPQAQRPIEDWARSVVVTSTPGEGLSRCVRGLRVGDRRLVLLSLTEMMSAGDADASNLAPGSALTLGRGGAGSNVLVEVSIVRLKPAPPPPATPPSAAPAPASASSSTVSLAAPPPVSDEGGGRDRAESSLRDRMARLAMAGRQGGSVMPVMSNGVGAGGSGGMEVHAFDASQQVAGAGRGSFTTAIQRRRGSSEVDDAVDSYLSSQPQASAPVVSRAAPEKAASAPATPAPAPSAAPAVAPATQPEAAAARPVSAASTPQQQFLQQQVFL